MAKELKDFKERRKKFYGLFKQRNENNPTIFVGQYPVGEWHERLGGGTQTDSIMDHIITHSLLQR